MEPISNEIPPSTPVYSNDSTQNHLQIVVYDPNVIGSNPFPEPNPIPEPVPIAEPTPTSTHPRIVPVIETYTVQCVDCSKWRLIPTKERYERIREHILEHPFSCKDAKEWKPEIGCEVDTDLVQDESSLWAIDKPNIAQPPPGWEREIKFRCKGSSKFADVYYISPTGKRLRSMNEVQKYLLDHPEFMSQGITTNKFSFQIPKPLRDDYVRKRPTREPDSGAASTSQQHSEAEAVSAVPISWAPPVDDDLAQPFAARGLSGSTSPDRSPEIQPEKKRQRSTRNKDHASTTPQKFKINGPRPPPPPPSNAGFESVR